MCTMFITGSPINFLTLSIKNNSSGCKDNTIWQCVLAFEKPTVRRSIIKSVRRGASDRLYLGLTPASDRLREGHCTLTYILPAIHVLTRSSLFVFSCLFISYLSCIKTISFGSFNFTEHQQIVREDTGAERLVFRHSRRLRFWRPWSKWQRKNHFA